MVGEMIWPVSGDRLYRHGWIIPAAVILLFAAATWWIRSSSPPPAATPPTFCPTGDSLSCYYIHSNRPVNHVHSLTYDGQSVPVVGVLPYKCYTRQGGCSVAGRVGPYVVWDLNPTVTFQLVAVFSPETVQPPT
jgi:hypothetical protein